MNDHDAYELFKKGSSLLGDGFNHQAAVVLERAVRLEPAKTSIREALARALYNSGQTGRAGEEFAAVVEQDPSNDYAHFGLGLCQARSGHIRQALGHLKMAVVMRPDSEVYEKALTALGP